jgi:hypothetical protein
MAARHLQGSELRAPVLAAAFKRKKVGKRVEREWKESGKRVEREWKIGVGDRNDTSSEKRHKHVSCVLPCLLWKKGNEVKVERGRGGKGEEDEREKERKRKREWERGERARRRRESEKEERERGGGERARRRETSK